MIPAKIGRTVRQIGRAVRMNNSDPDVETAMSLDPQRLKELFLGAAEITDSAQRQAWLGQECGQDLDLLARVQALLEAREAPESFLDVLAPPAVAPQEELSQTQRSVLAATIDEPAISERPGTVIGSYKLLEQIGEGGFGIVFMAEQQQPIRRKVALKVLKPGMDTRQVIARFEAERQALALMDHPNIAKVLDAGQARNDRPYFVMDLVRGLPITDFCDQKHLTPRERLELLVPVCQAVQHAHQKGIIHRDIKPSNVLVTLHDGVPVPKIIDFGIAKALGQQLTDKTLFTGFVQLMGTPLYMSPEQAELSGLDVDTRSDIYSLGVLLYELLTGTTPFNKSRLHAAGYDEILRIIREEEPPKPSTRISTLGQAATVVSSNRRSDPKRLSQLIRGELDWIVMKCLEKDRNRRYETASALAADVQRYLHDEPVEACPPSAVYRLWKFGRRYRILLATAAGFVVLLVLATAVSTILAARAKTERDKAVAAQKAAADQAAIAKAVNDFLQNDVLAQASPNKQGGRDTRPDLHLEVRTALDRAAQRISGKFAHQPLVEASIRRTIGETYRYLGLYPAAQPHLERALKLRLQEQGEDDRETLQAMNSLGSLYLDQGKYAEAESLLAPCLETCRRVLGERDPDTLQAMHTLALVYGLGQRGLAQAEPLATRCLELRLQVLGEENPDTLTTMNETAEIYYDLGEHERAETLCKRALEIRLRVLGEEHPDTLRSMDSWGSMYWRDEKYADAQPLYERTLQVRRRVLGDEHPATLNSMNNLALLCGDQRQYARAEDLLTRTLKVSRRVVGAEHEETLKVMASLASIYEEQGRHDQAEPLFRRALISGRRQPGNDSVVVAQIAFRLGRSLSKQQKYVEAESFLREALKTGEAQLADDWKMFMIKSELGSSLLGQKKFALAEPLLTQGYEGMKERAANIPRRNKGRLQEAGQRLVELYEAWGKKDKAAQWRKKLQ
jgi:serine/threonine protein kinase/tetratricopeptide (TPR) repeat protein